MEAGRVPAITVDHYCELMILYLLAIGSPTHPIRADSWQAWSRPVDRGRSRRRRTDPLFVHQYSRVIDFRGAPAFPY